MGLFSNWFKKNSPEDDEQVLASLSNDIQKRQARLAEIHPRERRWVLLYTLYTLSGWVAYISLWYMDLLPNFNHRSRSFTKVVKSVPVFLGPILILFLRRIVQIWFTSKGNAEEKILVSLRKQQRDKVEEIKKRTNYYSTRNLLERYDELQGADSALRKRSGQGNTPGNATPIPVTPQRSQVPLPPAQALQTPQIISTNLQQQLSPSPQRPFPAPRKQWYDKVADALLGDEDASGVSRYALICEKCFAHNGLVKESVWEETQYVCPKCGHFNPSFRAVREARQKGTALRDSTAAGTPSRRRPAKPKGSQPADAADVVNSANPNDDNKERSRSRTREEEEADTKVDAESGHKTEEGVATDTAAAAGNVRMEVDT